MLTTIHLYLRYEGSTPFSLSYQRLKRLRNLPFLSFIFTVRYPLMCKQAMTRICIQTDSKRKTGKRRYKPRTPVVTRLRSNRQWETY